jgi:hypothetical protein
MSTNISKSPQKSKENFSKVDRDERVAAFLLRIDPFRKKHLIQQSLGYDLNGDKYYEWFTVYNYLTDYRILKAITGDRTYGFFIGHCPRFFCVDIDDHQNNDEGYLRYLYNEVLEVFPEPSMLIRTPHGLHAYYFLSIPVPELLLIGKAREMLQGINVEIKPTSEVGLRIPQDHKFLDPSSMYPLPFNFAEIVLEAYQYHPIEIFGNELERKYIVEQLQDHSSSYHTAKVMERVLEAESAYIGVNGIHPGETNEAIKILVPIYRTAGFTVEESVERFAMLLARDYSGELRNMRRLRQRVESYYRNAPETRFDTIPLPQQDSLYIELIVEALTAQLTGPTETAYQRSALTKRKATLREAIYIIESWVAYIDAVRSNRQKLAVWDYLYPYFTKNTAEGYYPLSRNILQKINKHYERWLLDFLLSVGYLERAPYRYSKLYGICYYYRINGMRALQQYDSIVREKKELIVPETAAIEVVTEKSKPELVIELKARCPWLSARDIAEVLNIPKSNVIRYLAKANSAVG